MNPCRFDVFHYVHCSFSCDLEDYGPLSLNPGDRPYWSCSNINPLSERITIKSNWQSLASMHHIIHYSVASKLGWGFLVCRYIGRSTPFSPVLPVGRRASAPPRSWTAPSNQRRCSAARHPSSSSSSSIIGACMAEDISDKMLTFTAGLCKKAHWHLLLYREEVAVGPLLMLPPFGWGTLRQIIRKDSRCKI